MNLYDILGISNKATRQEIKEAYKRLIILYHPDKCSDLDAKEKFHEIQAAYEILYDDMRRKEYDAMNNEDRAKLYDLMKQYFTELRPEYSRLFNSVLDFMYPNEEEMCKSDVNNFNVKNILMRLSDKIRKKQSVQHQIYTSNYDLNVTLREIYNGYSKYVRVMKNETEYNEYIISLIKSKFIIDDPDKGKIIINIICENNTCYKVINEYDLLCTRTVSLSQYIYGSKIKIYDLNNNVVGLEFPSCLERKPIFIIKNKGLPKTIENGIINRGDIYVYINIEGINSAQEDEVGKVYHNTIEETLKLMFPPIEWPN